MLGTPFCHVPERVRARLELTLEGIVPDSDISKLPVHRMGSRWYGLHGPDSDLDLYAVAPVEVHMNSQLRSSLISAFVPTFEIL